MNNIKNLRFQELVSGALPSWSKYCQQLSLEFISYTCISHRNFYGYFLITHLKLISYMYMACLFNFCLTSMVISFYMSSHPSRPKLRGLPFTVMASFPQTVLVKGCSSQYYFIYQKGLGMHLSTVYYSFICK